MHLISARTVVPSFLLLIPSLTQSFGSEEPRSVTTRRIGSTLPMASTLEAIASEAGANDLKGLYQHRAVQDFDANDFALDGSVFSIEPQCLCNQHPLLVVDENGNPVSFDDTVFTTTTAPPINYDQNGNPVVYNEEVGTISINPSTSTITYEPSRRAKVRRAHRIIIPLVVIILTWLAVVLEIIRQPQ